jgi:hypothetical protein
MRTPYLSRSEATASLRQRIQRPRLSLALDAHESAILYELGKVDRNHIVKVAEFRSIRLQLLGSKILFDTPARMIVYLKGCEHLADKSRRGISRLQIPVVRNSVLALFDLEKWLIWKVEERNSLS